MPKLFYPLLACLWMAAAIPAELGVPAQTTAAGAVFPEPDSRQLESALQRLRWKQFKWVVESIPKLKADVDAYGPLGWEYVKSRYQTYAWRRNIDKLMPDEKLRLAELIQESKAKR